MKSKISSILILVGIIIGVVQSILGILEYFIFKTGLFNIDEMFGEMFPTIGAVLLWSLISSIIGLVISLILFFYLKKIKKNPLKGDFVAVLILGLFGIFFGMGIGGIIVLTGAIVELAKYDQ